MEKPKDYLDASRAIKEAYKKDQAHICHHLREVFYHLERLNDTSDDSLRLNSGIAGIDTLTGGLLLGEMVVINGDTGSGRTAMALHYAIQVAKETHKPVRIYSLAHSAHQITMRLLSMLTGIPITFMEAANLTEDQWLQLATAGTWLNDQDICVHNLAMPVPQLCDSLEDSLYNALLIIDGASLCDLKPAEIQHIGAFAEMTRCCVLLICNYSSVVPYVAGKVDRVLWIEHIKDGTYRVSLRWNRLGPSGQSRLYWNKSCLRFMDEPLYIAHNPDDCV